MQWEDIYEGVPAKDVTDKSWLQEGVHFEADDLLHLEGEQEWEMEGMHEGMIDE